MTKPELATMLRAWRAERGLSRTKAALAMGVSARTLQDWEQAQHSPRGFALTALLQFLNQPKANDQ